MVSSPSPVVTEELVPAARVTLSLPAPELTVSLPWAPTFRTSAPDPVVRVTPAAVTHGNLTVRVDEDFDVSQPAGGGINAPGETIVTPDTDITVEEEPARAFVFDPGIDLADLVDQINAVGSTPSDLIAILEALREAGALRAELIII